MFNPQTETWTPMAAQQAPRVYHSTAVLLPDGRVLSAGHDNGTQQTTAEIYSPPYLFQGPRPTISSAPSSLSYGGQFTISTPQASSIQRVALIRPSSTTHSLNADQRYVDLSFTATSGTTLSVTAPGNGTAAPPGPYMLFLVSSSGVPSVASFVSVTQWDPDPTGSLDHELLARQRQRRLRGRHHGHQLHGRQRGHVQQRRGDSVLRRLAYAHHCHGAVGRDDRPDPGDDRRRHRHERDRLHRDHHATAELSVPRRGARRLTGRLLAPGGDIGRRRRRDGQRGRRQLRRRRDARRCRARWRAMPIWPPASTAPTTTSAFRTTTRSTAATCSATSSGSSAARSRASLSGCSTRGPGSPRSASG